MLSSSLLRIVETRPEAALYCCVCTGGECGRLLICSCVMDLGSEVDEYHVPSMHATCVPSTILTRSPDLIDPPLE
jgi:hypothetical protein